MKEKLTVKERASLAFHVATTSTYRPVYAVDIGGEKNFDEFKEYIEYKASDPDIAQVIWTYYDPERGVAVVINKTGVYRLRDLLNKKSMEISNAEITKLEERTSRAIKSLLEMNRDDEPVVRVRLGRNKEINDIVMKKLMVPFYTNQIKFTTHGDGTWVDFSYKDAEQGEQDIDPDADATNESCEKEERQDECVDFDKLRED